MEITSSLLAATALLALALSRVSDRFRPSSRQRLDWWQTPFVLAAVLLALLIVLTPEFFALGLLGDTTFFDLLVLPISLQLGGLAVQVRAWLAGLVSDVVYWLMTPRVSYLIGLSVWMTISGLVSSIARVWNRISLDQEMV